MMGCVVLYSGCLRLRGIGQNGCSMLSFLSTVPPLPLAAITGMIALALEGPAGLAAGGREVMWQKPSVFSGVVLGVQ